MCICTIGPEREVIKEVKERERGGKREKCEKYYVKIEYNGGYLIKNSENLLINLASTVPLA